MHQQIIILIMKTIIKNIILCILLVIPGIVIFSIFAIFCCMHSESLSYNNGIVRLILSILYLPIVWIKTLFIIVINIILKI